MKFRPHSYNLVHLDDGAVGAVQGAVAAAPRHAGVQHVARAGAAGPHAAAPRVVQLTRVQGHVGVSVQHHAPGLQPRTRDVAAHQLARAGLAVDRGRQEAPGARS